MLVVRSLTTARRTPITLWRSSFFNNHMIESSSSQTCREGTAYPGGRIRVRSMNREGGVDERSRTLSRLMTDFFNYSTLREKGERLIRTSMLWKWKNMLIYLSIVSKDCSETHMLI
jgi:hypothetical protein